jgi:hypothetical protein
MKHKEDKNRLDDGLRRAINTTTPAFDAEAWRQKYHAEFNALLARAGECHKGRTPRIVRLHVAWWLGTAAAVVLAGYGLMCWLGSYRTQPPLPPARVKSPAELVTMSALSLTYRRGGMEALDKQLDEAVEELGPRPMSVPTARLLTDL